MNTTKLSKGDSPQRTSKLILIFVLFHFLISFLCLKDLLYNSLAFSLKDLLYNSSALVVPGDIHGASFGTEKLCAVGMWNKDTHQLQANTDCAASKTLFPMEQPKTNKRMTFLLLYYNSHKFLSHQVKSWTNFSKAALDQIQFVIIDDGSAFGHTAADFLRINRNYTKGLDIVVFKIDQDLAWNIGGARNLGFLMANTEWVFMNDADIEVRAETIDFVTKLINQQDNRFNGTNSEKVYLYFKRWTEAGVKNHPAVMLIKKEHFWMLGGCDEDFVGHYGQTDPHFTFKIKMNPTLHIIATAVLMDAQKISPLYQLESDLPCPVGMACLQSYKGQKLSRNSTRNKLLFEQKRNGGWSNMCLRFTWKRVSW